MSRVHIHLHGVARDGLASKLVGTAVRAATKLNQVQAKAYRETGDEGTSEGAKKAAITRKQKGNPGRFKVKKPDPFPLAKRSPEEKKIDERLNKAAKANEAANRLAVEFKRSRKK